MTIMMSQQREVVMTRESGYKKVMLVRQGDAVSSLECCWVLATDSCFIVAYDHPIRL